MSTQICCAGLLRIYSVAVELSSDCVIENIPRNTLASFFLGDGISELCFPTRGSSEAALR